MRRLLPLAYGLAVAGVLAGSAFGLQAVALRQPPRGDLVAARAVAELTRYRVVTSVEHLPGRPPTRGVCVHAKIPFPGASGRRWSAIVAAGDYRLAEVRGHVRALAPLGAGEVRDAAAVFALAGCPHFFSRRLVQGFAAKRRFELRDATFRGRRVYALPFHVSGGTVELYVDRDSATPVGARLSGAASGWSALEIHRGARAVELRRAVLRRLP